MRKAKDIINKINKDLDKETTDQIKKESREKAIESKQYELREKASEFLSEKYKYILDDIKDFKNEINKISKGVYFNYKNNINNFFDHENAYPGDLTISEIWFWADERYSVNKEVQYKWRLALDVEGLFIEDHSVKLNKKKVKNLIQIKQFMIYQEVKDGFSWEGGANDFKEYKIPTDRYDLFFEKYVANITRKVKEKSEFIRVKKEIKKKKKFFFF